MTRRLDREELGVRSIGSARTRTGRRGRRRDESGQALVELALVLPLVALLMGVAFNGWNSVQLSLRLTSAARAGAIQAASDLTTDLVPNPNQPLSSAQKQTAWDAATTAVNQEEGVTNLYQDSNSGANNYVDMSTTMQTIPADSGDPQSVTINVVTITISRASANFVPFVGTFPVTAHATARYS